MIAAATELAPAVGSKTACGVLGVARATLYRRRKPAGEPGTPEEPGKRTSPRALSEAERRQILDIAHSQRFADESPAAIVASLLDEGRYVCSIRTLYRILAAEGEVRERRNQRKHPVYTKPELLAEAPNEVWSWDTTKLLGPAKWT